MEENLKIFHLTLEKMREMKENKYKSIHLLKILRQNRKK